MQNVLAAVDAIALVSILIKTVAYTSTLLAAGSALALVALQALPDGETALLRKIAVTAAIVSAVCTALRIPVRASFLMGGTWDGAFDPTMLSIVADSPLGFSVLVLLAGLSLILLLVFQGRLTRRLAAVGAVVTAASFALRGHALNEPRFLLSALVTIHILGLAFWIGIFVPLYRTAGQSSANAASLSEEFGRKALWVVGALVLAGALTLWLLGAANPGALSTSYGQWFAVKLALFAGALSLGALNKLRLTPDLAKDTRGAAQRLRRSLAVEAGLIATILAVTALLTTVTTPPGELSGIAA